MRKNIIPKFYGLRIYLITTLLYFFLVLPFLSILIFIYLPDLTANTRLASRIEAGQTTTNEDELRDEIRSITFSNQLENDSLDIPEPTEVESVGDENLKVSEAISRLFNLLIVTYALGFIFNLPYKRYFRLKRQRKRIPRRLHKFCKKYILYIPEINSLIIGFSFISILIYEIIWLVNDEFQGEIQREIFVQYFYISIIATVLSIFFIYFWQKHRVHIKYLDKIFSAEELQRRIFKSNVGKIRNRLIISSIMTTLLPLIIVMLYLFLGYTSLADMEVDQNNELQIEALFGNSQLINDEGGKALLGENKIYKYFFYYNAWNSVFMLAGILSGVFLAFIYIFIFVRWTTSYILSPVRELLDNMKLSGQGDMSHYSIVRTNDEIGLLTEGYNQMSRKIGNYISNISMMNEAYSRFVPNQFLDILGKESYTDIQLGDQVEKEMTILFADIRNFTDISESMTPVENFNFINRYLGYMEPVISRNNGFIDKYIGDSIMALFQSGVEDALNAAIEMRIKLTEFNQVITQFGMETIDIGIGIHTGDLMLGVVGGEGRMDGTVISDAVNLAARLEGLNKIYGASIIISEDSLVKIEDPSNYDYRFLDIVKVKGKKKAVYIFELLNGDSDDCRFIKMETKALFGKAIDEYRNKEFETALRDFSRLLDKNPMDQAAMIYLKRCKEAIKYGVPEDWDGVETFQYKS